MNIEEISNAEPGKGKKQIILIVKIVGFIAIIYYAFFVKVDFHDIVKLIYSISPLYFLFLFFLFLIVEFIQAPVITYLMKPYQVYLSPVEVYQINLISSLYSILPLGAIGGGVVRWYRFSKENKKRSEVFTVIVLQRILSILSLLFIGIIVSIFQNPFEALTNNLYISYLTFSITIGILIISMATLTFSHVMNFVDAKIVIPLLNILPDFISAKMDKLWKAVLGYKGNQKVLLYSFFFTLLYKIGYFLFFYFTLLALAPQVSFFETIGLYFMVSFVIEIVPFFGALGVRGSISSLIYPFYGVLELMARSHSFLIILIAAVTGGILEFVYLFIKKKK